MNFQKFKSEYDLKKIALVLLVFVGILGGIAAGYQLVTTGRIDIRNRASNSCPADRIENIVCKFTVKSSDPFTYSGVITSGAYSVAIPAPAQPVVPSNGSIDVEAPAVDVPNAGEFRCSITVTAVNACGSKSATAEKAFVCLPGDTPGDPNSTPPPSITESPICQDCTHVKVELNFEEPPGAQHPTLTPPSVYKDDLKIGRLTLEFKGACGETMSCADIKKIEFRAYDNDKCEGQPNLTPIPLDSQLGDSEFGRYGSSIKCSDKVVKPGDKPYEEGALFRLHQANGDKCRCYKVNVEFKDDPEDRPVCPNMPKENICCSNECTPPEIVDNPDDPNDGCPGDPDGPRPLDTPVCNFTPLNSCPRLNAKARFKTFTGGSGGDFGFDDDFKGGNHNGRDGKDGKDEGVGAPDGEEHDYIYNDGGSYDVRLTCNNGQSCTKRIHITCESPNGGGGGNPPGGGGGNPPPPGPTTGPSCPAIPQPTGVCVSQPIQ